MNFPFNIEGLNKPTNDTMQNYEFCGNIKAYLRQRLESCEKSNQELMVATGYANARKFATHQKQWHYLKRDIPIKYLDAIKVDMKVLEFTIELDCENTKKALEIPRFPEYYICRLIAAVYITEDLPLGITEDEAIEWIHKKDSFHRCCILYPGLLVIAIEPDGRVNRLYFTPKMQIFNKHWVKFSGDGSEIGTTRLG